MYKKKYNKQLLNYVSYKHPVVSDFRNNININWKIRSDHPRLIKNTKWNLKLLDKNENIPIDIVKKYYSEVDFLKYLYQKKILTDEQCISSLKWRSDTNPWSVLLKLDNYEYSCACAKNFASFDWIRDEYINHSRDYFRQYFQYNERVSFSNIQYLVSNFLINELDIKYYLLNIWHNQHVSYNLYYKIHKYCEQYFFKNYSYPNTISKFGFMKLKDIIKNIDKFKNLNGIVANIKMTIDELKNNFSIFSSIECSRKLLTNKSFSYKQVLNNPDFFNIKKISTKYYSKNPSLTWKIVDEHFNNNWDWCELVRNPMGYPHVNKIKLCKAILFHKILYGEHVKKRLNRYSFRAVLFEMNLL